MSRATSKLVVASDIISRLRDLKTALKASQAELARRAGVGPQAFSAWMTGKSPPPRIRLSTWAEREGWPLEIFLEGGPMPSTVLRPAPKGTVRTDRVIREKGAPYLGDTSERQGGATGDVRVTQLAETPGPLSEVALMVAEKVGRVIEEFIRMDEAGNTRDGRAVLADALEDFARRCLERRQSVAIASVFDLASRLRRGEM